MIKRHRVELTDGKDNCIAVLAKEYSRAVDNGSIRGGTIFRVKTFVPSMFGQNVTIIISGMDILRTDAPLVMILPEEATAMQAEPGLGLQNMPPPAPAKAHRDYEGNDASDAAAAPAPAQADDGYDSVHMSEQAEAVIDRDQASNIAVSHAEDENIASLQTCSGASAATCKVALNATRGNVDLVFQKIEGNFTAPVPMAAEARRQSSRNSEPVRGLFIPSGENNKLDAEIQESLLLLGKNAHLKKIRHEYLDWRKLDRTMRIALGPLPAEMKPDDARYILVIQESVTIDRRFMASNRPMDYEKWTHGTHYWWRVCDAMKSLEHSLVYKPRPETVREAGGYVKGTKNELKKQEGKGKGKDKWANGMKRKAECGNDHDKENAVEPAMGRPASSSTSNGNGFSKRPPLNDHVTKKQKNTSPDEGKSDIASDDDDEDVVKRVDDSRQGSALLNEWSFVLLDNPSEDEQIRQLNTSLSKVKGHGTTNFLKALDNPEGGASIAFAAVDESSYRLGYIAARISSSRNNLVCDLVLIHVASLVRKSGIATALFQNLEREVQKRARSVGRTDVVFRVHMKQCLESARGFWRKLRFISPSMSGVSDVLEKKLEC